VNTTYQWDAAGNLTKKLTTGGETWEYLWDARDKMTKVRKQPNGGAMADVASYSYDAMGRRFQKTAGANTTTYYQDGLTPIVEVTGAVTKRHRSFEGDLGNVVQKDDGTNNTFYAYDARLGNVIGTFGTDGRFSSSSDAMLMDAFGSLISGTQPQFGLGTKQRDADTELYYFNSRWYDSKTGLFVSKDPKEADDVLYNYVLNNPVNSTDPTGEDSPGCDLPWVGDDVNTRPTPRAQCLRRCCAAHDQSYHDHGCTAKSWGWNVAGAAGGAAAGGVKGGGLGLKLVGCLSPCAKANNKVMDCFALCAVYPDHNEGDGEWYCAKEGRYINIGEEVPPNDFKNLEDAKKACSTD